MKKKVLCLLLPIGMLFLLTGCIFRSGEELYVLPQLPEDYVELQTAINQVMDELGAEYTSPIAGDNTQNIQIHDLDQDGEEETAVTFFWVSGDPKPLKIYFFRMNEDETYAPCWVIEGEATDIYSIDFQNLGGDDDLEAIVTWQISTGVRAMAAYAMVDGSEDVVELMYSSFTLSTVTDLDMDNEQEILLVQLDTTERTGHVELYDYSGGLMVLSGQAELSQNLNAEKSVKTGCLSDQSPAVFVTSEIGDNGGYVTDIIAWKDDSLVNLTLDEESMLSTSTLRYYTDFQDVYGADINNDGVLNIPIPQPMPLLNDTAKQMYIFDWYQYDADGNPVLLGDTFHCYDDGWFLILPQSWEGVVTAVRQESISGNASAERTVTFYYIPDGNVENAQAFLSIYRLSGTNRTYWASLSGRFTLLEDGEVIYAAKLWDTDYDWDCGITEEELIEWFSLIETAWSSD